MPGTAAQARQGLRLGRCGKFNGRDAGGAEERIHQGAVFGAEMIYFSALAREFCFEQANVAAFQQALKKIPQDSPLGYTLFGGQDGKADMRKPTTKRKPRKKKRLTKAMRRKRLEKATAAYFASLTGEARREENELGRAVASASSRVDFDADY